MGSGGGQSEGVSSRGGGAIKLIASEKIVVRGTLTVDGAEFGSTLWWPCGTGAGSGGGILISAPDVILMGLLSARGGGHGGIHCEAMFIEFNGGGGGGGRIIICYERLYRNLWSTFDVSPGDPARVDWMLERPEPGTVSVLKMFKWPF
jgi:hypothetical protein